MCNMEDDPKQILYGRQPQKSKLTSKKFKWKTTSKILDGR